MTVVQRLNVILRLLLELKFIALVSGLYGVHNSQVLKAIKQTEQLSHLCTISLQDYLRRFRRVKTSDSRLIDETLSTMGALHDTRIDETLSTMGALHDTRIDETLSTMGALHDTRIDETLSTMGALHDTRIDETVSTMGALHDTNTSFLSNPFVAHNLLKRSLCRVLLTTWNNIGCSNSTMAAIYLDQLHHINHNNDNNDINNNNNNNDINNNNNINNIKYINNNNNKNSNNNNNRNGNNDGSPYLNDPTNLADVYGTLGKYFLGCGLLTQASILLQRSLEEHEIQLDPDDPKIGHDLVLLSRLHEKLGHHNTVIALHNQALEIFQGADSDNECIYNQAIGTSFDEDDHGGGYECQDGDATLIDLTYNDKIIKYSDILTYNLNTIKQKFKNRINYQYLIASQFEALANLYHRTGRSTTAKCYHKKASSIRLKPRKKVTFAKPVTYEYCNTLTPHHPTLNYLHQTSIKPPSNHHQTTIKPPANHQQTSSKPPANIELCQMELPQ